MQDVEIESLLQDAGYMFNPSTGQYEVENANADTDEVLEHNSEDVADILEIPIEDLQRWEQEQMEQDRTEESKE